MRRVAGIAPHESAEREKRPTEKAIPALWAGNREGVRGMDRQQIKETLEKQLQLLSERSEKSVEDRDLYQLTGAMVSLSTLLLAFD
nr:MAG TPA: hypothetical protein [Caudoviricetes sp.]